MNIKYRKVDDDTRPEGYSHYPLLQVYLRNGLNMRPVLGLVDSGACDCIFSASLGEVLGLDVPSGRPHKFAEVMPLLGQTGFFDHYQIVFERFKRKFEINTKENAVVRNKRGHGRGR